MKQNNKTITVCKGIAIILMVIGHSGIPEYAKSCIYLFHMPLFFFLSGFCFKDSYLATPIQFLKRKLSGLYFPFIGYGILFVCLHNIFQSFHLLEYYPESYLWTHYSFSDIIVRCISVLRFLHSEELLGGFWFLHSLFWSIIIFYFLHKFLDKEYMCFIIICLSIVFCKFNIDIPIVHIKSRELIGALFLCAGYLVKTCEGNNWLLKRFNSYKYILFLLSFFSIWVGGMLSQNSSIQKIEFEVFFPFVMFAFAGIFICYQCSTYIAKYNCFFLEFIGSRTLLILTFHFLSFKIVSLIIIFLYSLELEVLSEFPVILDYSISGWWILYSIIGIIVPLLPAILYRTIINEKNSFH